jgi:hydrogenase-4 component F
MRLLALCALPVAAAAVGVLPRHAPRLRLGLLLGAAAAHAALAASMWWTPAPQAPPVLAGWVAADALGLEVLTLVSLLFLATAIYTVGFLRRTGARGERTLVTCLLVFLGAASLVALSQHLALLWVGMEAATLAVAPLIFHRRDRRSLEAVWKFLLISSVAIALALLGIFFLATAQAGVAGRPLLLPDLVLHARALQAAWLRAAFAFLLVGFGAKMGLAPFHTWKPDAYGEAPGLAGGLMAGALTSCAFLGVARITQVTVAAGLGGFARPPLLSFGLLSLAVAATLVIGQRDLRRLLAYSSVEHMGLLVIGLGLGGIGTYGSALHLLNSGLAKGWLFLAAGNVVLASGTSAAAASRGLLRTLPLTGGLLLAGLFAITGSPPFGLFLSELTLLRAAFETGHPLLALAMVALLAVVFAGMARLVLEMTLGEPAPGAPTAGAREDEREGSAERQRGGMDRRERRGSDECQRGGIDERERRGMNGREGGGSDEREREGEAGDEGAGEAGHTRQRESLWLVASPLALAAAVLVLGVYLPEALRAVLAGAATALGGSAP